MKKKKEDVKTKNNKVKDIYIEGEKDLELFACTSMSSCDIYRAVLRL